MCENCGRMRSFEVTLAAWELEALRHTGIKNPTVLTALNRKARHDRWISRLSSVCDLRVWPIVDQIEKTQKATFQWGSITLYGADLCGRSQTTKGRGKRTYRYPSAVSVAGMTMLRESWTEIKPDVQKALDELEIAFDPGRSELTCRKGKYALETCWTDIDGYVYRHFDMGHGASGFACSCYPIPYRPGGWRNRPAHLARLTDSMVSYWIYVHRLPETQELVQIDGWRTCGTCGKPIRPSGR